MNTRTSFAILAVAGLMAATPAVGTAHALDNATVSGTTAATKTKILRTSDEIMLALKAMRAARLAILDGAPDRAKEFVGEAIKNLKEAQADADVLTVETKQSADASDTYVPFETSMSLAEGFMPADDDIEKIKEAQDYLVKGDEMKAAEVLNLADVDVVVTAALLPINGSVKHAEEAVNFITGESYYEANLALKAIEDSVVVDTYPADTVPMQGEAG